MSGIKRFYKRNSHNIIIKPLAGFGRSVNRLYENRNHDSYSNGEMAVLQKIAKHRPILIIDGGANVGNYSRIINHAVPDCRVFAFEPVKSTFDKLVENIKGTDRITPINKGLYKDNSIMEINVFPLNEHSSIYDVVSVYQASRETIELIKGDDFIEEHKIKSVDFLKLDVEGAEYDALMGFENSLKKGIIKAVQFEYGHINITTRKLLIDYYEFFEKLGFVIGKVYPKYVEFRKYNFSHEDFIGPNFLAVKKDETALINSLSKN